MVVQLKRNITKLLLVGLAVNSELTDVRNEILANDNGTRMMEAQTQRNKRFRAEKQNNYYIVMFDYYYEVQKLVKQSFLRSGQAPSFPED